MEFDLRNRTVLLANFTFLYHVMKASENLLRVAAEKETDSELKAYFMKHAAEEQKHDDWLADDLKTAGIDVKSQTIPFLATEMVGSVYYLIYHVDPAALLGYMVVLERNGMSKERLEELEGIHGKALVRTLRYHVEHDTDHSAEIRSVIDGLPRERQAIVHQVATRTAQYLVHMMQAINTPKMEGLK